MSKAYDMIFESLNEIINDLEENDGKNLNREVVTKEKPDTKKILIRDKQNFSEGIIEHRI